MNYEIITDRFEIEKMAEDMFLSDDEILVHIDYADLLCLDKVDWWIHSDSMNLTPTFGNVFISRRNSRLLA